MFGIELTQPLIFAGKGVIGALGFYALQIYRENYKENFPTMARVLSRVVLGGFAGYIWFGLGFPDTVNPILAGMVAPEFIDFISERFKNFGKKFK